MKKIASILLVLCMLLTSIPMNVFATEDVPEDPTEPVCTHVDTLVQVEAKEATCKDAGWEAYVACTACDYTTKVEIPALNHKDTLVSVDAKAPTCYEAGYEAYEYCTACDYTTFKAVDTLNHKDTLVSVDAKAPTCYEAGYEAYEYCTACDYTTKVEIPALNHKDTLTQVEAKNATCKEAGYEAYEYCTACDYTTKVEIPALNHKDTLIQVEAKAATCEEAGYEAYEYCTACDYTTKVEIPAKGHSYGEWKETPATTTTDGSWYHKCENCEKEETLTIPRGHNLVLDEENSSAATCTTEGKIIYVCASHENCDANIELTLNKLQHELTKTEKAATCEGNGYVVTKCNNCNTATYETIIPATGHIYNNSEKTPATCTSTGKIVYYCSAENCTNTKEVPLDKLQHNYVAGTPVAATCTSSGYTTYTCEACKDSYNEIGDAAKGHNYSVKGSSDANCINSGVMTLKCADCEGTMTTEVPALGHDYVEDTNAATTATCAAAATKTYKCSRCQDSYTVSEGNKNEDHSWNDWVTVEAATNTSIGYKTRTCKLCGKLEVEKIAETGEHVFDVLVSETAPGCETAGKKIFSCSTHTGDKACNLTSEVTIPATGHKTKLDYKAATCDKAGYTKIACAVQGCTYEADKTEIPAIGHIIEKHAAKAPTCTEIGWEAYETCSRCDHSTYKEIPATDHTKAEPIKENEVAPTCEGKGSYDEVVYCSVCKAELSRVTKEIEATGHKYSEVVTKATLSKDGKIESKCSVCGDVLKSETKTIAYPKTITLSVTSYTYDGKVKTPKVTVKDSNGKALTKNTDYTISSESGRKNPGKYTITVTFKGNYSGSKALSFTIAPQKATGFKATSTTSTITLSWNKVTGATGYAIYKLNTKTNKLELVTKTTSTSYKISKLSAGTKYQYAIRAYTGEIYGDYTSTYTVATNPGKVSGVKVTAQTATSVTLSWNKVTGATGYRIYSYNSSTKKYTSLGTVKGKTTFTAKNLKINSTYKLAVRAYINTAVESGTVAVWGAYSSLLTHQITPVLKVTSPSKGKATLSWTALSGVSGYEVYYSTKKDSGFTKFYDASKTAAGLNIALTSGATFYFRVKAYVKSGSTRLYSGYQTVAIKVK